MSPIGRYFKGHGSEVMADMKKRYGDKEGESAFYATANARGMKPGDPKNKPSAPKKRKTFGQRMAEG